MNRTHIETFSYQLSPQYYFNRLLKIWLHNNWGWLLSFFPPSRGAIHSKPSIYLCRTYHFIFGISYDHLLPVVRLCSTPRLPYVHTFKNSRNKQKRPFLYFRRWTNRIHSMGTNYPYTLYLDRHYLPLIKLYFFHFTIQFVQIE